MKGPLYGTRIVELVSMHCPLALRQAMAFAGQVAARLGAHVIRLDESAVDSIGAIGPHVAGRSALSAFLDGGKSGVQHIAPGDGLAALHRLEVPPQIILCDQSAFEPIKTHAHPCIRTVFSMSGSDRQAADASAAESEFTVMATSGLLDLVGDAERAPLRLGGHQLSYSCGLAGYAGSIAALTRLQKTGEGEVVRATLAGVGVWLNWKSVAMTSWTARAAARLGRDAEWQVLRCADGWIALVYLEADWPVLRAFVDDPRLYESRFDDRMVRRQHARLITSIVEESFMHHTRAELRSFALERRLPLGPVWSPVELESDAQYVERAFLHRVGTSGAPSLLMPRLPVLWNGEAFPVADGAPLANDSRQAA